MDFEKERQEAIAAGERALHSLRNAQNELNSAKNWGVVDLLGGGFVTSMVKRSKMNNAQGYMDQAKYDLQSFSRELRDVDRYLDLNINTSDFLSFADWFFDGLAVDWMVQSRINKARDQVDEAIWRVEAVIRELRAR